MTDGLGPQLRGYEDTQSAFELLKDFYLEHDKLMPPMTTEIAAAVEAHRKEIGAISVHVTLGPNATAGGVASQLRSANQKAKDYWALPEDLRQRAEIAQLQNTLRDIRRACQRPAVEMLTENKELGFFKSKICGMADCFMTDVEGAMALARKEGVIL